LANENVEFEGYNGQSTFLLRHKQKVKSLLTRQTLTTQSFENIQRM